MARSREATMAARSGRRIALVIIRIRAHRRGCNRHPRIHNNSNSQAVATALSSRNRYKRKRPHPGMKPFCSRTTKITQKAYTLNLHAERRSAAAGALHVRILELETRAFQSLDVVDNAAVQVHHGSGIDEYFQPFHVEGLVHHSGGVLECRSEEHTSELQSHFTLVCRLLLVK